jgi:hypothetical protein
MKKLLFLSVILTAIYSGASAQPYARAIGVRGGISSGFEYRVFSDDLSSYKILVSTRHSGFQATALKEFHQYDVFDLPEQISFVYGIGLHAGCERWRDKHYIDGSVWYDNRTAFVAGLDGLAALELTLNKLPLTVGFEVKPYFNMLGHRAFEVELFDFAFTLKYLF